MTRKKVKLMWIVNDGARKASLKKRRVGLLKKVSELTILCGIEAFIIIYSPDDPEPAVWPSRSEVQQLLVRFQNMPDMERYKKMMNQESYLKERMGKLNEQSRKHLKKNRELELAGLMQQVYQENGFDSLDQNQLGGLTWLVEEKMKELRKRIEYFQQIPPVLQPAGPFPPRQDLNYKEDDGGDGDGDGTGSQKARGEPGDGRNHPTNGGATWDQWLTDMTNNPEHNVVGGSSTKSHDFGPPHPFSIAAGSSFGGGPDFGFHHGHHDGGSSDIFGLGLSHNSNMGGVSGGHNFDIGLLPHENEILRGNNFDLGMPFSNNMTGGGSSAGSNNNIAFDPWQPRGLGFINPGGNNYSVGHNFDQTLGNTDMGAGGNNFDMWPPHINNSGFVNNVDHWLNDHGDMGGESLGLGLLPGSNFTGSSSAGTGNPFIGLQGMHRRGYSGGGASSTAGGGGSDLGLPPAAGYFGASSSDIGLQPFDVTKTFWPNNNFNP